MQDREVICFDDIKRVIVKEADKYSRSRFSMFGVFLMSYLVVSWEG